MNWFDLNLRKKIIILYYILLSYLLPLAIVSFLFIFYFFIFFSVRVVSIILGVFSCLGLVSCCSIGQLITLRWDMNHIGKAPGLTYK